MKNTTLILIILVFASLHAYAQKGKKPRCADAMSQPEINRCADEYFKKADKRLNVVYNRIIVKLTQADRANLIEAQRAWLKYRSTNCWANRQLFEGGSLAPTVESGCLEGITDERIRELIRMYETEGG